ncbi:hypothetical protein [Virgisporangium aurantiacum]|uniref:Uncharacterized protein n=1 Tax=Virgisporangium aurantiacum TaxID=175570 RepID=A0A8J3ZC00_9ACTN|nr:hypothetical protein [Virgisporangium aurantiacum]GIJ58910.1 hypothetical protein Vau01_064260 [Virgisporangium aurantiacum]
MRAAAVVRRVRRVRRRVDEIRPARARPPVDRHRTYGYAVVGVAMLSALAWCTDQSRLALGFVVAAALGVLWVAWTAHRAFMTTALVLGWWFLTAPAVALISATGIDGARALLTVSPATTTVGVLGAVAGLLAVLSREPRPALTVGIAWATNTCTVVAASYVVPTAGWMVGYVATIAVLVRRTGFRARGRRRGCPPGVPPELYDLLTAVPGGYVGAIAGRPDRPVCVLTAPSGTYSITALVGRGTVAVTPRGTRLLIDGRRLPKVRVAIHAARLAQKRLRTPVQPVLAVLNAGFTNGLTRVTTDGETDVLVIRGDLLAARLSYGSPVLAGGQLRRLARRIRAHAPHKTAERSAS